MKYKISYMSYRRSPQLNFHASEILEARGIVHAYKLAKEHAKGLHPDCFINSVHMVVE